MTISQPSRLLLLTLLAATLLRSDSSAIAQTNDLQPLVTANTAFALDLYSRFKVSDGNLFFSPYSISTCLAMTSAGARGNTEKQLAHVLHFAEIPGQLHSSFGALQKQLNEAQKTNIIELDLANGLWMQKGHSFLAEFKNTARQDYGANLNQADFRKKLDSAREKINNWVGQMTKGKITDFIPLGLLDQTARLVLVNAIYFKGTWSSPFETNHTASQPFHISIGRKVEAPLMHQVEHAGYFENGAFQAIQLPYIGDQLSMVIMLPRQISSMKTTENFLTPQSLAQWLGQMNTREVDIYLPKFKLEIGFELANTLAKMGMPDAFGEYANFSGIDGTTQLHISTIMHKAYVEVNEAGTEAAAATGAVVKAEEVRIPAPPVFRADHPFVFLIRDNHSGSILFLGRLVDPTPPANPTPTDNQRP